MGNRASRPGFLSCVKVDETPAERDWKKHQTDITHWNNQDEVIELDHVNNVIRQHEDRTCHWSTAKELARPHDVVCGTPLGIHRDPLHPRGGIQGGVLDVDGDGEVTCHDCHDAAFMSYPVEAKISVPEIYYYHDENHQRLRAVQALEDLPHAVKKRIPFPSKEAQHDMTLIEDEMQNISQQLQDLATECDIDPEILQIATKELYNRLGIPNAAAARLKVMTPYFPPAPPPAPSVQSIFTPTMNQFIYSANQTINQSIHQSINLFRPNVDHV